MTRPGVRVEGLRELRRDLKAIDRKLPAQLNKRLKVAAEPVRRDAAALAPRRSGRLAASLKVRSSGSRILIASSLPYAKTIHFGGRHPLFGNRDRWYTQEARPFISIAAARHADHIENALFDVVEDLMTSAGFHR